MNADKSIFGFDPIIGCPFDDSEMQMVEEWRGFRVGMQVAFRKLPMHIFQGEVVAIGQNAKYLNGTSFTAFAVKIENVIHFTTHREVHHIV